MSIRKYVKKKVPALPRTLPPLAEEARGGLSKSVIVPSGQPAALVEAVSPSKAEVKIVDQQPKEEIPKEEAVKPSKESESVDTVKK